MSKNSAAERYHQNPQVNHVMKPPISLDHPFGWQMLTSLSQMKLISLSREDTKIAPTGSATPPLSVLADFNILYTQNFPWNVSPARTLNFIICRRRVWNKMKNKAISGNATTKTK